MEKKESMELSERENEVGNEERNETRIELNQTEGEESKAGLCG